LLHRIEALFSVDKAPRFARLKRLWRRFVELKVSLYVALSCAMSREASQAVELGKLGRAQGLRGEVRLWAHNPDSPMLRKGAQVLIGATPERLTLLTVDRIRRDHKGLIIGFAGCSNRSEAEKLTGQLWFCQRSEFQPLKGDEVYVADLVGLVANDESGQEIGRVSDVLEIGPNLILELKTRHGKVMVPYVDEFVEGVDLETRTLTVRVVEGLLETGNG
jgi:16S rRNA processing protein RimM